MKKNLKKYSSGVCLFKSQNKLFDILRIIKDCRNETKYKRYSMNNFDDLKKAKESDFNGKGCEEKLSLNESLVNLMTFQNLNNNLDKGINFLKKNLLSLLNFRNFRIKIKLGKSFG